MSSKATAVKLIDAGLDEFFNFQRSKKRRKLVRALRRGTLARFIERATGTKVDLSDLSDWLQVYRLDQNVPGATKYRLGARGYGRNAQWYVLAGPSLPAETGEGMTLAHAEWVAHDLSSRMTSDYLNEIVPAASKHTMIQPRIEATQVKIEQALQGLLADVRQDKVLWEQATGRVAEMILPMADELILAELNGDTP